MEHLPRKFWREGMKLQYSSAQRQSLDFEWGAMQDEYTIGKVVTIAFLSGTAFSIHENFGRRVYNTRFFESHHEEWS